MSRTCQICGVSLDGKRKDSQTCSIKCRKKKSWSKEYEAKLASPSEAGLSAVEELRVPSKRESILNKVISDSDLTIFKIQCIAEKLEKTALVEELLAIAEQASHITFQNEVRMEVDSFDMIQRMYDWDSFEARTGMVVAHKKLPL